jgi:hypothetical protein
LDGNNYTVKGFSSVVAILTLEREKVCGIGMRHKIKAYDDSAFHAGLYTDILIEQRRRLQSIQIKQKV